MPLRNRWYLLDDLHLDLDLPIVGALNHTQERIVATAAHNHFEALIVFQGPVPVPPEQRSPLFPCGMLGTGFQQDGRGI